MPSKPNGPQRPGRFVRQQVQDIELDANAIDRKLERLAQGDLEASHAQGLARRIVSAALRVLSLGSDDTESVTNGNGEHQ